MYMVAIAWLYIAILMAVTEKSAVAGIMTFLCYGLAPLALFLWLAGTPARRRFKARRSVQEVADAGDHRHAQGDQ